MTESIGMQRKRQNARFDNRLYLKGYNDNDLARWRRQRRAAAVWIGFWLVVAGIVIGLAFA